MGIPGGAGGAGGTGGTGGAAGSGTLNLSGHLQFQSSNSFTIHSNGTLNIGNALVNDAVAGSITGLASITNNGLIQFNQSDAAYTLDTAITGVGRVVHNSSGVTTLAGANTFSGGTTLTAGGLVLGNNSALGTGALTVGGNATLDSNTALYLANNISLAAGANLDLLSSNALTLGGSISGSGGLVKNGAATVTLTGANTYTGGTTINAGTLAIGAGGSLATTGAVNLAGTGTLDISGSGGNQSIGSLAGVAGSSVALGGSSLALGGVVDSTYNGVIGGSGGLIKNGAGVQTLGGANTFSGGVTLYAGGLVVGNDRALGTGALTVGGASTLDSNQTVTLNNNITLNAGLTVLGSNNLTLNGDLSGIGSLTKEGAATLTLNGTNTYTGGTTINAGTLALGAGASLYASGIVNLTTGATFDLSAGAGTQAFGTLIGSGTVNLGANTLTIGDASNGTFSGAVAGSGGLIKEGTGTQTLTGASTFTGGTTINAGTLAIGAGGSLADTGVVNLAGVDTGFDISAGGNQSIGTLAGVAGSNVALGGNTLTLGGVGNASFEGKIDGTGSLVKNGAGVQTLNGANTFSGGVTLNGGGLVAGNAAALGSGELTVGGNATLDTAVAITLANTVTLNAGLTVLGSNDLTLGGTIAGTGSLLKSGSATLTLTGANTYSGGTTVNSGTLALGAGGSLAASGAVHLAGTGTLDISAAGSNQTIGALSGVAGSTVALGANTLTLDSTSSQAFSGEITGIGGLVKSGSGEQTLNSASTYSGGTTLNAGGLVLGHNAALGSGTLTVDGAATLGANSALTLANHVALNAGLTVLGGQSISLTGDVSGSGSLTKEGTATLTLSGANTYAGGTAINGGTLVAANASALGTGNVTVGSGAGLEVVNGTTLAVGGDLTFQAGSIYRVQADPTSLTSSKISVGGTATLGGSVLHVSNESNAATDFQVGKTYTILHATQVNGTFSAAASNYAYLDAALGYVQSNGTTTDVTLKLQRKGSSTGGGSMGFAELTNTRNQAAAANAIESLGRGNPLFDHIETLTQGTPEAVLASVSGDTHAGVQSSLVSAGAYAPGLSSKHLLGNLTAGMHAGAPVAQSDGPLPASAWPSSKALPAWAEVVGHWQRYDGDGNAAQLKQRTNGLFLGMDQEVGTSGWRLGGSVGYTNANGKVADRSSESDVNSYSAAVYGGKSFGTGTGPRINVLGGLAYTWHDIETTRRVTSLGQTLKADYSAHTAQLFAEVGYAIGQYDKFGFEPFAGVSLGQQRTGSFQEHGGFAALKGRSSTDDLASTTLGVRVHSDFQLAGKEGRLRATVGWRHAFGDVTAKKTMAFEGGQNFTVAGTPLARNTAVLGLEADVALSRSAALVLGYQGEMGSGQRDHSVNAKLRWAF